MTNIHKNKKSSLKIIFTAILILLIFVLAYSYLSYSFSGQEFGIDKKFEIEKIKMTSQHEDKKIVLKKKNNDPWVLNQHYQANKAAVEELIQTLHRIEIKRPVKASDQEKVTGELDTEGIKTSVYIKAYMINLGSLKFLPYVRKHQTFLVGKDAGDQTSTFMKEPSSETSYQTFVPGLERGISSLFNTRKELWINPVIIDLEKKDIEAISLYFYKNPEESYVLQKTENDEFAFFSYEEPRKPLNFQPDSSKVERFLHSFENIRYESLMNDALEKERMERMIKEPAVELSVNQTDGTRIKLTIFERKNIHEKLFELGGITTDPDRFYIKLENGDFVVAQYYVFNRILRTLSFFQNN